MFLVSAFCVAAFGQATPVASSISVIGEADMSVSPDNAVFTLEVVNLDKDLSVAKQANDTSVAKVLSAAKNFKVDPNDVQTDRFTISPKYLPLKAGQTATEFVGYEVTKRILVTFRDLKQLDSFLARLIAAGVNKVVGVEFADSQYRLHQEQVRALAVKNAKDKAIAYAQQLGQRVGRAYSIREEGADYPSQSSFLGNGNGNGDGDAGGSDGDLFATPGRLNKTVTFAIGQIKIEETIYIIFTLE
jgi:uncharacterized protein YggE